MRTYLASLILAALIPACGATSDDVLSAGDDELLVEMNAPSELDVTANDEGVVDGHVLELVTEPAHGTARFDEAGVLHYEPAAEFLGEDELHYLITNPDGSVSEARVAITVGCATCAIGATVQLRWDPSPESEGVDGFRMYFAATEDEEAMVMFDDVAVDQPDFDPTMPTMIYDAWEDLRLRKGETVCFRLTAYNEYGESGFSNAACKTVDGLSMRFGL